jgi:EmrB/QacA subfamily drug resistance transporter
MVGVFVLGAFMSVLDTTIVNVALRSIGSGLHASLASIQWISTGYLLALGATIPIAGWTTKRYGARPVYIISLVMFTLGSALCGLSTSLGELIGFRVLQGIGGALILPVGQAALTKAAGPRNMPRIMGAVGIPIILAPVIGPTIGGAIVDGLSWRWIFYVNLPIGILAVVASLRYFVRDDDVGRETAGRLDLLGLALLSAGLVGIIYGVSEVGILNQIGTARVLVPFAAGVVLCIAFIVHARRASRPLLDVSLYGDRGYALASIVMTATGAALFGALIILPLYFQEIRGQSAFHTGLLLIPQGLGSLVAMALSGRITTRLGGGIATIAGGVLAILGTLPFIFAGAHTSYWLIEPVLIVRGLGLSLSIVPAMTAAIIGLRRDQVDDATPQLNVLQRVGGSIGGVMLTVVLSRHIAALHPETLDGAASAFNTTWIWAVGITLLSLGPALALARVEHGARQRGAAPEVAATEAAA